MKRRAFTLIELLLVTSLIAALSLAVFMSLSNGLKLWQRTQKAVLAEDITIFFDRFAGDLRNSFNFSTLRMEGDELSFAFPTVVLTKADRASIRASEEYVDQLGRVQYAFDPADGSLVRRQANYSQGLRKMWGEARTLFSGATEIHFRYLPRGSKDFSSSAGAKGELPTGVEVEVRYKEGQEERSLKRFFMIPVGI